MSVIMSYHVMRYYICLWWDATWQDVMQCNVSKNVNNPLLGIRYLLSIPIAGVWTEFIEADGSSANAKLSMVFANQHTSQFTASPNYFRIVWLIYDCITMLNKSSCGAQSCDLIILLIITAYSNHFDDARLVVSSSLNIFKTTLWT